MENETSSALKDLIEKNIQSLVIPWLKRFIEIPNLSRNFDSEWASNGLLEKACELCLEYGKEIQVKGYQAKMYKETPDVTPLIFGTIEATKKEGVKNIMVYGHIDKQPHMTEKWREGLHPTKAVEENGMLYGRGGADDGYNFFTILAVVKALQDLDIPHDRFILFYECDEESNSKDIPHYLDKFKTEIGNPDILFCLDGGSFSNKLLGINTSLRGLVTFDLKIRVLEKSMHSGTGSGIVPSTFRIARQLLERIECGKTGRMIDALQVEIPPDKQLQGKKTAQIMGQNFVKIFPVEPGVQLTSESIEELYFAHTWAPQLEIIGQSGIPEKQSSGNVMREETVLKCSLRIPPTLTSKRAYEIVKEVLEKDPPYNALVECILCDQGEGWNSKEFPAEIVSLIDARSKEVLGMPAAYFSGGGSIPFIQTLQLLLPSTLFFVSGVLLPGSSIHAPNEKIDIQYLINFSKAFGLFLVDYSSTK